MRTSRWFLLGITAFALLVCAAFVIAYFTLRGSLPQLNGERHSEHISAEVKIERDALGTVSISAVQRDDVVFALGFVHAQERFFEMDLMRRTGAGELAELFGAAALSRDKASRVHRFRTRAEAVISNLSKTERASLSRYTQGVNAGLQALSSRQFPYLITQTQPAPWREADTLLVAYAMFFDLQSGGSNQRELDLARMQRQLSQTAFYFLTAPGTQWDAPINGEAYADPVLPPADEFNIRKIEPSLFGLPSKSATDLISGSNSFAVAGAVSTTGAAWVANDMHLGLRVPNIWFRTRLRYSNSNTTDIDITGLSLPGIPAILAGSNGHIAWSFTNSYGDWMDWVKVKWSNDEKVRYQLTHGDEPVTEIIETIKVKNAADENFLVRESRWGPILADWDSNTALSLRWTAHLPESLNLRFTELETAQSLDQALTIATGLGMPAQNFIAGDKSGRIGWTIAGLIPRRVGSDGRYPSDWTKPGVGWDGWVTGNDYPKQVDPENHRLWSANARMGIQDRTVIGDGGYALGARAQQIRDGLIATQAFSAQQLLDIQLDDRAIFLKRWHTLLQSVVEPSQAKELIELRDASKVWTGHASVDAVDYRLVRAFRTQVHSIILDALAAPMRGTIPDFVLPALGQAEGIVWKLIEEQPLHMLPAHYSNWNDLLLDAAQRTAQSFEPYSGELADRTWGERNTASIRHPLSRVVPGLSWLLDMPATPLAGDASMPRVQGPSFGASERFAVSPGHEAEGYLHMPGGQSGHPLSPFYGAGHADWESGKPTPFLPGKTEYVLTLSPNH